MNIIFQTSSAIFQNFTDLCTDHYNWTFARACASAMSRDIFVQGQENLDEFPAEFSLQNVLQLHEQRLLILRIDSLALWKIINEEDAVLIPKNRRENFSSGFFTRNILGLGETLRRHSTDCCFVSWS